MSFAETVSLPARLTDVLVVLGGGQPADLRDLRDVKDHAERSSYLTSGLLVASTALLAGALVCFVAGLVGAHGPAGWVAGVAAGLLVAALGRVLATAPADPGAGRARRVLGDAGRALVAVALGVLLGELAALAVFSGAIDRELAAAPDAARAAVAHGEQAQRLAVLRADRAALDAGVSSAAARRDRALVVARCEYRPGPGCPTDRITGDAGRGPETAQADAELADAGRNLVEATAQRDTAAPALDADIASARARLDADSASAGAAAAADTGLDARWAAMNAVTTRGGGPLALRVAVDVLFVLLCALPLVSRLWRGETDQDRRILAGRLRYRAEEEADTAVAVNRARVRAALELGRAPEWAVPGELEAAPARAEREPAERERVLTRREPAPAPSAERPSADRTSAERPAPAGELVAAPAKELVGAPAGKLAKAVKGPLDVLPGPLPGAVRTLSGMVRPLVPGPVARLAATAPRTVRMARGLWEEVEELQFTIRQRRTVRMTDEEYHDQPTDEQPAEDRPTGTEPEWRPGPLTATAEVVPEAALPDTPSGELTGRRPEIAARRRALARGRRELPGGR